MLKDDYLSISGIISCHICPRRFYFMQSGFLGGTEPFRYTICKQISTNLGYNMGMGKLWEEIEDILHDSNAEIYDFFEKTYKLCRDKKWEIPDELDVPVRSERLGIHGIVDKIYDKGNNFAITRSSRPPDAGVYSLDRLRLACYVACIEETFGKRLEGGCVEYIAGGISRYAKPGPRDRRSMIRAIKSAKRIVNGEVPKKPMNAPCESCIYSEQCNSGPKSLSLFVD